MQPLPPPGDSKCFLVFFGAELVVIGPDLSERSRLAWNDASDRVEETEFFAKLWAFPELRDIHFHYQFVPCDRGSKVEVYRDRTGQRMVVARADPRAFLCFDRKAMADWFESLILESIVAYGRDYGLDMPPVDIPPRAPPIAGWLETEEGQEIAARVRSYERSLREYSIAESDRASLYREGSSGDLRFVSLWVKGKSLNERGGDVGEVASDGRTSHPTKKLARAALGDRSSALEAEGYVRCDPNDLAPLTVRWTAPADTGEALDARYHLEDRIRADFELRGLGMCYGGAMAFEDGCLEVECGIPPYAKARELAIARIKTLATECGVTLA